MFPRPSGRRTHMHVIVRKDGRPMRLSLGTRDFGDSVPRHMPRVARAFSGGSLGSALRVILPVKGSMRL